MSESFANFGHLLAADNFAAESFEMVEILDNFGRNLAVGNLAIAEGRFGNCMRHIQALVSIMSLDCAYGKTGILVDGD